MSKGGTRGLEAERERGRWWSLPLLRIGKIGITQYVIAWFECESDGESI